MRAIKTECIGELLKLVCVVLHIRFYFLPCLICRLLYLLPVFISASVEEDLGSSCAPGAGEHVGLHYLKRKSDVRVCVYIRERGGDVARTHREILRVVRMFTALSFIEVGQELKHDCSDRHREQDTEESCKRVARDKRHDNEERGDADN